MKRNERGFTLIEILIVLVVLAALAGLAIPGYINTVEKSRRQEALIALTATKDALQRAYALNGAYPTIALSADFAQLDFDPNTSTAAGTRRHFNYQINSNATGFVVSAERNDVGFPEFGANPYTVTLNQAGVVTTTEAEGAAPASTEEPI